MVTGWSIHSMQLSLYDAKDRLICSLLEEGQRLDSYAIGAYYRIHASDEVDAVMEQVRLIPCIFFISGDLARGKESRFFECRAGGKV